MARIIAYGSSTVYGLYDTEGSGFAERLKSTMLERVVAGQGFTGVYNRGRCAINIPKVIDLVKQDVPLSTERRGNVIGVFMLGAYESSARPNDTKPRMNVRDFTTHLRNLSQYCREAGVQQVFLGLPPLDDTKTQPYPGSGETYTNAWRQRYDRAVRWHAHREAVPYVGLWKLLGGLEAADHGNLAFDNLHVNSQGHHLIYDALLPVVDQMLLSQPHASARVVGDASVA